MDRSGSDHEASKAGQAKPSRGEKPREEAPAVSRSLGLMSQSTALDGANDGQKKDPEALLSLDLSEKNVLGDYQLIRLIGRGGMGVVYEGLQRSLRKRVAVKVLPLTGILEQRMVRRFQNEAWAAARLEHPNIVPVHYVGCERGVHFYVMQFVEGGDLAKLLRELKGARRGVERGRSKKGQSPAKGKTLLASGDASPRREQRSESEVVSTKSFSLDELEPSQAQRRPGSTRPKPHDDSDTFVSEELKSVVSKYGSTSHPAYIKFLLKTGIQAAEALDHAHQTGIVHRDIKPSNLMLDIKGNVWVTDFGLAQIQNSPSMTATGDIVGTLRYMSPEQALGKRVIIDHRTDIYSLGVTLYEMLTLETAFGDGSREAILRKIAFDDPIPPRKIDHRIPVELETIVMKAVSKNPDERYQTAAELAADLTRFREDEPICGRRPTLRQRAVRWANRHRSAAMAAAALSGITFISAVIIAFVSWSYYTATAAMLETEQQQTTQLEKLLNKSEGLRLAANAALQLPDDPGRSIALAMKGAERHPSGEANEAILNALDELHELHTFLGHENIVGSVAVSPDGTRGVSAVRRFYFGHHSSPARLWDLDSGASAGVLQDEHAITSAVFSPDRFRILTTGSPRDAADDIEGVKVSNHVHLWDGITQTKLISFPDAFLFEAHQNAFDSTGRRIVLPAYGNQAIVYDSVGGHPIHNLQGHAERVVFAAFDPTGQRVATASDDQTVRIWDPESGMEMVVLDYWKERAGENDSCLIDTLDFSPQGNLLATGSLQLGVQLWDVATGNRLSDEYWPGVVVGYSPDGGRILTFNKLRGLLEWRSTDSGALLRTLHDPSGSIIEAVISPDGKSVATFGRESLIRVFDIDSGEQTAVFKGHSRDASAVAYLPSGEQVLSGGIDRTVRLWSVFTATEQATLPVRSFSPSEAMFRVSGDGRLLATTTMPTHDSVRFQLGESGPLETADGMVSLPNSSTSHYLVVESSRVVVHRTANGEAVRSFAANGFEIDEAVLGSDGNHVAIRAKDKTVWLWDSDTNQLTALGSIPDPVTSIRFNEERKQLLLADTSGSVRLWDTSSGELLTTLRHDSGVESCEFSRDGEQLLVTTDSSQAIVWNLDGFQKGTTIQNSPIAFDRSRFSFDGRYVIAWYAHGKRGATCWNAANGDLVSQLDVVSGDVECAVSPVSDQAVFAADPSGTILWNFADANHTVLSDAPAGGVQFSVDGEYFVSATPILRQAYALQTDFVPPAENRTRFTRWNSGNVNESRSFDFDIGAIYDFGITADDQILANIRRYPAAVYGVDSMDVVSTAAGHAAPIRFLQLSADGTRLVTASWDQTARVWDSSTGDELLTMETHTAPITAADLSREGRRLLTGTSTGETIFWNVETGKALHVFQAGTSSAAHVHLNATNDHALIIGSDGTHTTYDLLDQEVIESSAVPEKVEWAEFSPDGQRILFLPRSEAELRPDGNVQEADSPSTPAEPPRLVITSLDGTQSLLRVTGEPVSTAHFHPDGERVILLAKDKTIRIIDATDGETIRSWRDSEGRAIAADFSADGKIIIVGSPRQISLWETATGSLLYQLRDHGITSFVRHTFQLTEPTGSWLFTQFPHPRITRWPLNPYEYGRRVAPRTLTESELSKYELPTADR